MLTTAIVKFFRLSVEEKKLFFKAVQLALWARLNTTFRSSNRVVRLLGTAHKESYYNAYNTDDSIVNKTYRAMRRSSVYLPFKQKCLIDAIVVKKMLKKYGIDSTLYLGVSKDAKNKLVAHAWLRYGNFIIVGKKGTEKYVALEWFT